jgi:hypothetical protein
LNSNLDPKHTPSRLRKGHDEADSGDLSTVELWHDDGPPAGNLDPASALVVEPLDSEVRDMARPSSILIALQAERLIKTYDFTETSMLRGLRVVGRISGGLDRPRPSSPADVHQVDSTDPCRADVGSSSRTRRALMLPKTFLAR